MNMQKRNSAKGNSRYDNKHMYFDDLKRNVAAEDKLRLESLEVVSLSENARWLIDYWCSQDLHGLILMPFSEHWLAHIFACMTIRNKLYSK